jgi:hypothetical protein
VGWHYRNPSAFPNAYHRALLNACLEPSVPQVINSFPNLANLKVEAERFRWFRWCIRQRPSAAFELARLLDQFETRTFYKEIEGRFILFLIAQPDVLSEFIRLNPQLSDTFAA